MERVHEIPAFHETETDWVLKTLKDRDIDTSICYICGEPIVQTERLPYDLREKWSAWRHKKKFFDWNISGVTKDGVICGKLKCLWDAAHQHKEG